MVKPLYYSNSRFAAESSCGWCDKVGGRHEHWCVKANLNVAYAWAILAEPGMMDEKDRIMLHGMGARY